MPVDGVSEALLAEDVLVGVVVLCSDTLLAGLLFVGLLSVESICMGSRLLIFKGCSGQQKASSFSRILAGSPLAHVHLYLP